MDNLSKDVAAAQRLGYGVHYGRYKVDYPHTKDHSVDLIPEMDDAIPPKYCRHCGKPFNPKDGHQVVCSEECRHERRKEMNRINKTNHNREKHPVGEGVCPVCGRTFQKFSRHHTYCGKSCAAVQRNKKRRKKV